MKKGILGAALAIGIAIIFGILILNSLQSEIDNPNEVFQVTLADPDLSVDGVFSDQFEIPRGKFEFRFVPNGDSPKTLSINLIGESLTFSEDFELVGTPHETAISLYYTWDYEGNKMISSTDKQKLLIEINPYGNLLGPVSVEIIPLIEK